MQSVFLNFLADLSDLRSTTTSEWTHNKASESRLKPYITQQLLMETERNSVVVKAGKRGYDV